MNEVEEFVEWHEQRMEELAYPDELRKELRWARTKFFARLARKLAASQGIEPR